MFYYTYFLTPFTSYIHEKGTKQNSKNSSIVSISLNYETPEYEKSTNFS